MSAAARGSIQTVLGPVAPDAFGPTLMHEHVLCDLTPPELAAEARERVEVRLDNVFEIRHQWIRHYGHHILDDRDVAVSELARFRTAGGSAVVELTCDGIAPDPAGLAEISRRTSLHIVAGCGPYVDAHLSAGLRERTVDAIAAAIVQCIHAGIGESGVCAGVIGEIGLSTPCTRAEIRALTASALAQATTGASINIHPPRTLTEVLKAIDVLRAAGADVERLIVSHVDRTLFDVEHMVRLADTGVTLEFDFFGIESAYYPFADVDLPNDGQRVRYIIELARRGYATQIAVSHDICTLTRLARYGGHGYAHLLEHAVPLMRRRGLEDGDIRQILVLTPRRLLALA